MLLLQISNYFLDHSDHHTVFTGLDKNSGEVVALSEWIINSKNNSEVMSAQKHVSSIEQELNYLVKLKHQNLAHYLSIRHEIPNENKIIVEILRNFVIGNYYWFKRNSICNLFHFRFQLFFVFY